MTFKSGFVALIGRPNAGKSTLLNTLMKQKIAIVSDKPQTTRNVIRGIRTDENSQIVFLDTPGIHKPQHELGRQMNKGSFTSLHDVDLIYYLVDATAKYGPGDQFVIELLKSTQTPVFLILNKIDLLKKQAMIECLSQWSERYAFTEVIPVSALTADNADRLIEVTKSHLSDSEQYYPNDQVSDYPEAFMMAEIIREKVLQLTHQEIPHSIAVLIENTEQKENSIDISAVILVERDSQKGIIIGKNGSMKNEINKRASMELRNLLQMKVHLELFVKVETDWRNRVRQLIDLGYKQDPRDE
ncbi:MAG: GTPase Era [Firmicutes bacterium HGW-Firmicutes-20]|nr:MAG: GTPase Era [Firmicutes bacterium HGW-Firmicutes-20]PKM66059.1 MAG: GTPase Era [Firmicutes bacterium HGW-Firmicutes-19]